MKSMRDFITRAEEQGQLKRIKAEVDWNLELSHIAKLNEEKGGPALLFENVKDYDTPVITSVCTTTQRLALIMGLPLESSLVDLYKEWAKLGENLTPPKLVEALAVLEAWGFRYVTNAVWDKQKIGMGYWFRGQHELLLVGVKGEPGTPPESERRSSVFAEARRGHSQKPACVYEWIERAFPDRTKLEMYCRQQRDGWAAWGNEA